MEFCESPNGDPANALALGITQVLFVDVGLWADNKRQVPALTGRVQGMGIGDKRGALDSALLRVVTLRREAEF